jgi:hypothetical protein
VIILLNLLLVLFCSSLIFLDSICFSWHIVMKMSSSKKHTSSHVSLTRPRITRSVVNSGEARSPARLLKVAHRSTHVNGPTTCCDFGLDRVEKYPDADFCNPCKLWDERDISNKPEKPSINICS